MLTTKTSIYALAAIAGLSIGFAPQASFAQNAGAATAGQAIHDYVEKQDADFKQLDKFNHPTPAPSPTPAPTGGSSSTGGTSGFVTPPAQTTATPELSWWEKLKLAAKVAWIMATSSSKEESKNTPSKVEQSKTSAQPTIIKTAAATELKTVELKTAALKTEALQVFTTTSATKLVAPEVQKPAEINLNAVEQLKAKFNESTETLTPRPATKLVLPEAHKPAEINLNAVEQLKAKFNESTETLTPRPAAKLVSLDDAKAKTVPALRMVTTVSRIEVSRPTVNVARVVPNLPRPVVVVPHINIPVVAVRR
jgi:hypothetical protein